MYRIVFFGLPGAFSTVPLRALCHSGYVPLLVVQGAEPVHGALRAPIEMQHARPGLLKRMQTNLRARNPDARPSTNLQETAREMGVDLLTTPNANDSKVLSILQDLQPDAFIICGFSHLLSRRALAIPHRGGLNLHPGALPAERGAAPLFWALREGRTTLNWTIHVLDEGEDSGDIVTQGQASFEPGVRGQAVLSRLAADAAPQMVRALRAMMGGDLVRSPQPKVDAERKRRPTFQDGRLDLTRSAADVYTFVAGCADSYSLWAECAADRFFIRKAIGFDAEARPEFEWFLSGDRLMLRCNPGLVELELKPDGALFSAEYEEEIPAQSPAPDPPEMGQSSV